MSSFKIVGTVYGATGEAITDVPCSLHKDHSPTNLITEQHHPLPQSWQHIWVPEGATVKDELWDSRTVPICPTGHRNVHVFIVALMHQIATNAQAHPTWVQSTWATDACTELKPRGHATEYECAQLTLKRWQEAGGDFAFLIGRREWGES